MLRVSSKILWRDLEGGASPVGGVKRLLPLVTEQNSLCPSRRGGYWKVSVLKSCAKIKLKGIINQHDSYLA